jgi:hypothetical protein
MIGRKLVVVGRLLMASLIGGLTAVVVAPAAHAEDSVTYEVFSTTPYVTTMNVEYYDHSQRILLENVSLPWRMNATVVDANQASDDGAEVRADWRPSAAPSRWVTVRIFVRGSLICENTLDVGNATCYGNTHFKN